MELWIVDGNTQDQVENQLDQCNNSLLGISEQHRSERNSMTTSVVRFRFVELFVVSNIICGADYFLASLK